MSTRRRPSRRIVRPLIFVAPDGGRPRAAAGERWSISQTITPTREKFFGPLGITNIRTFIDPQNPSRVAIMMDVPDMDKLQAAMQTPAAAEAMAHDGVVASTLVILVEA